MAFLVLVRFGVRRIGQAIRHDNVANLLDLVRLRFAAARLEVKNLYDAGATEYVMIARMRSAKPKSRSNAQRSRKAMFASASPRRIRSSVFATLLTV
jgi:hypothetical protein